MARKATLISWDCSRWPWSLPLFHLSPCQNKDYSPNIPDWHKKNCIRVVSSCSARAGLLPAGVRHGHNDFLDTMMLWGWSWLQVSFAGEHGQSYMVLEERKKTKVCWKRRCKIVADERGENEYAQRPIMTLGIAASNSIMNDKGVLRFSGASSERISLSKTKRDGYDQGKKWWRKSPKIKGRAPNTSATGSHVVLVKNPRQKCLLKVLTDKKLSKQ